MSIKGQGHFFSIYFPGFVCFVLYWDKTSGERLQDHWSSGCVHLCKAGFLIIMLNFLIFQYFRKITVERQVKMQTIQVVLKECLSRIKVSKLIRYT